MATSLRARLLLGAALWIGLALLAAWFAIAALLRDTVERAFDARLDAVMLSLLASVEVDDAGTLALGRAMADPAFGRVRSGWYWQIADAGGVRLRSRSLWTADLPAAAPPPGGGTARTVLAGPDGQPLRALARMVSVPGAAAPVTVTVGGPLAVVEREVAGVSMTLAIALGVLGTGLTAAVLLQTMIGLAPFGRLGRQLAEIRRGRRERLDDDTFAEVAPLVREVNALVRHNSAVIERARTHAANLAHALKTPLSALAVTAEQRHDPEVAEAAAQMARMIRHHLRRARAAASHALLGTRTELAPVVADLRTVLEKVHAERAVAIAATLERGAAFAGERQDLEEMLGNLMDNACKWARARVAVTASVAAGRLAVTVSDDGPGLAPADIERALARGGRLDGGAPGDGFGLAIALDLARLYGGDLTLGRSDLGGLAARLDLPAAPE
ncbi:MAG: sensor histidine kinase [Alphaproteobacteria bacterium]|nr:sensor histidine kinase [Alphaproteobacteria bacterium]